ncbi:hypothetical protein Tco_0466767, partial [Tanacetum coccineum]
ITEEMKHTEHYRMYAEVFRIDVPLTQSQPKSSALKRSTMIRFHFPERRSTHLTPPVPVPTIEKADKNVIDDSLPPRIDEPKIPGTRLEPWSDKEIPEVERTNAEEVEV